LILINARVMIGDHLYLIVPPSAGNLDGGVIR